MIVDTTPKKVSWFSSEQFGAPQMKGSSNGNMLSVLDACLIEGWGEKTAASSELLDGMITINFGLSHGFLDRQLVEITGFTNSELNGKHHISSSTVNSIKIDAPTALSADGTLVVKLASLGWESMFAKTSPLSRAYRSKSSRTTNRVLYLDMSYPNREVYSSTNPATRAMVTVCEDMQTLGVPIVDMTETVNNKASNVAGSLFWYQKRGTESSHAVVETVTKWRLVGNADFFYFIVGWSTSGGLSNTLNSDVFGFGAFAELSESKLDDTFLAAYYLPNDVSNVYNPAFVGTLGSQANSPIYIFNEYKQAIKANRTAFYGSNLVSGASSSMSFPSKYGNILLTSPYRIYDGRDIRGFLHSLMFVDNNVPAAEFDSRVIDNALILSTRSYLESSASNMTCQAFYIGD